MASNSVRTELVSEGVGDWLHLLRDIGSGQIGAAVIFKVDTFAAFDVVGDLAHVIGRVLDHVHQNADAGFTKPLNVVDFRAPERPPGWGRGRSM